ncbi:hypothetical protein MKW98_010304, partial [Papaver atlanticum]
FTLCGHISLRKITTVLEFSQYCKVIHDTGESVLAHVLPEKFGSDVNCECSKMGQPPGHLTH